jgi:hypothetical protein
VKRWLLPSMWLRKVDAVFVELAAVGQAEDLEAARIGEDRAVPAHEGVQPAEARISSWPGRR